VIGPFKREKKRRERETRQLRRRDWRQVAKGGKRKTTILEKRSVETTKKAGNRT